MDYLGYYQLALQEAYGGEFPGMSAEEFDRRCPLKQVPAALKALYMALGTQRICRVHSLIPMPEELTIMYSMVSVHTENDIFWMILEKDLAEENPLIHVLLEYRNENGIDTVKVANDGETRFALHMANLIAESARKTNEIRKNYYTNSSNIIKNLSLFFTRKMRISYSCLNIVLLIIFLQSRTWLLLPSPWHELLVFLSPMFLVIPLCTIWRLYLYWNVWIRRNDDVYFISCNDEFLLICDLTLHYLRWNYPDLWIDSETAIAEFHAEVALSNGSECFCQCRYEINSENSGMLLFPNIPPIPYFAKKQSSVLMRTALDDSGSLHFVYVDAHCNWRLPKRHRLPAK